ncbi:sensor histidine kinase [Sphaerisporangium sp. NBC_01403]|uniref:sensor histidine kinase n=1 Tax=Sphaerisporangium sp. NBC_01403 TaxID=2903599 RepID=UPI00324F0D02
MRGQVADAGLAFGLLAVCFVVNDPVTLVAASGRPGVVWAWWAATAAALAGAALRRRLPLPMLVVCTLAAAAHLAVAVPPTAVDLALPILLYTVAAGCRRVVSLSALAVLLLFVTGQSLADALSGTPRMMLRLGSRPGTASATWDVGRDDGSGVWTGVIVIALGLLVAWALGYGTRNRRAYLDQLHARTRHLERERDQRAELAVAAERGRISREVHDVVAHGLSVIVIQAQGAEAALDTRPDDTRGALRAIVKTGRDSLTDMRRVLDALGEVEDAWHPQPGLARLPGLLAQVREAGTPVRYRVEGGPAQLPSAVDLSAYRVVQEALTNVMKHAGSGATADVVVSYRDTEVGVEVTDDGRPAPGGEGSGNGLRGMRRRVEMLGGRLSAGPGSGGGFVVRASLPIAGHDA